MFRRDFVSVTPSTFKDGTTSTDTTSSSHCTEQPTRALPSSARYPSRTALSTLMWLQLVALARHPPLSMRDIYEANNAQNLHTEPCVSLTSLGDARQSHASRRWQHHASSRCDCYTHSECKTADLTMCPQEKTSVMPSQSK